MIPVASRQVSQDNGRQFQRPIKCEIIATHAFVFAFGIYSAILRLSKALKEQESVRNGMECLQLGCKYLRDDSPARILYGRAIYIYT